MGLLALTVTGGGPVSPVHKTFFPAAEDARFAHFMMVLLWPVTAIRAMDLVGRPLLETFHRAGRGKMFCAEERFRRVRRRCSEGAPPSRRAGLSPWRTGGAGGGARVATGLAGAVEKFLQQKRPGAEGLARSAPARAEAGCQSYSRIAWPSLPPGTASARTAATWRSCVSAPTTEPK